MNWFTNMNWFGKKPQTYNNTQYQVEVNFFLQENQKLIFLFSWWPMIQEKTKFITITEPPQNKLPSQSVLMCNVVKFLPHTPFAKTNQRTSEGLFWRLCNLQEEKLKNYWHYCWIYIPYIFKMKLFKYFLFTFMSLMLTKNLIRSMSYKSYTSFT